MLYSAALRQSDPDWLHFVNTTFNVAMFGHQNDLFDQAVDEFFGLEAAGARTPGLPDVLSGARRGAPFAPRGAAPRAPMMSYHFNFNFDLAYSTSSAGASSCSLELAVVCIASAS